MHTIGTLQCILLVMAPPSSDTSQWQTNQDICVKAIWWQGQLKWEQIVPSGCNDASEKGQLAAILLKTKAVLVLAEICSSCLA